MKRTIRDTSDTLRDAILLMQEKIIESKEDFINADLSIEVRKRDGNDVVRANPCVQEYRALVKDFYTALKAYKEIRGTEEDGANNLSSIRERFKVAK